MMRDRFAALERRLGKVERTVPLGPLTTFRIGGPADAFYRARTPDALAEAVRAARELELPHFILGVGANILVGDRGFRGLVIHNVSREAEFVDGGVLRVASGEVVFPDLINASVARGLGGLHHYVGIPSTVGGAIWQNLHFLSPPPERERTVFIEEVFDSCELLEADGSVQTVGREDMRFGYDYSRLHDSGEVVLRVTFRLQPAPEEELRYVMRENLQWRDEKHPDLWLYPCAGSIFKKIEGVGAGRLIDQCGLKGHVLGNAGFFHKHANIIVNLGGATAGDVRRLIELAQTAVKRELGHELSPEIGFIGEF